MPQKKILIVDDEKDLCEGLEKFLQVRGYAVEACGDGKKALKKIRKESFALIILDLHLPGLSGEKVFDQLKQAHLKTKIIVLTGHGTVDSAIKMTKKGVTHYIQKPFQPKELLEIIRKEMGTPDEAQVAKELYRSVGLRIRSLREKEGWTLQQLAEKTHLSSSLVSQVENGKLAASLSTLLKITHVFQVPLRHLF